MFNVKQEGFKTFKCLIWGGRGQVISKRFKERPLKPKSFR